MIFFPLGVFPTGCLSMTAPIPQWLLLFRSHHLILYNPCIGLHCIAGHAWCVLLIVNFRLSQQPTSFLKVMQGYVTWAHSLTCSSCIWKCHRLVIEGINVGGFLRKKKPKANIIKIALQYLATACVPSITLKIEQF